MCIATRIDLVPIPRHLGLVPQKRQHPLCAHSFLHSIRDLVRVSIRSIEEILVGFVVRFTLDFGDVEMVVIPAVYEREIGTPSRPGVDRRFAGGDAEMGKVPCEFSGCPYFPTLVEVVYLIDLVGIAVDPIHDVAHENHVGWVHIRKRISFELPLIWYILTNNV